MSATLLAPRPGATAEKGVKIVRVALAGCGVVGGELVRLIDGCAERIAEQQQLRLQVVSVLVRDPSKVRPVALPRTIFTNDVARFCATDADVVVEAIGGTEPARLIAGNALARGARFVTANKALLAECGSELLALAQRTGGSIDFEAAVGGGIPVIRALRSSLRNAPVRSVTAILNGTCNYILTRIEQGASFGDALHEAQRRGFAEADPSRDLEGIDSADKLRVLAWLVFGVDPRILQIDVHGIAQHTEAQVRTAAAQNATVRLIASCHRSVNGLVAASVQPMIVPRDSVFGRTINEQNIVVVDFGWNQPVTFSGPGAGGVPTASALLGDILCC